MNENIYTDILDKLSRIKDDKEKLTDVLYYLEASELNNINLDDNSGDELSYEYQSIVNQITDALYNGFVCYLNPETLEIEQASGEGYYGYVGAEISEQNDDMIDEFGLSYPQWDSYVRFEPFNRTDLVNRMQRFLDKLRIDKSDSLFDDDVDEEGIIAKFYNFIERNGYLEEWNSFKRDEIESYVRNNLVSVLENRVDASKDIYSL